jgi:hypothetical protein
MQYENTINMHVARGLAAATDYEPRCDLNKTPDRMRIC